jgi:hypothetical protein
MRRVRAVGWLAVACSAVGCSLLTDLDGLSDPELAAGGPDAQSASADGALPDGATPDGAGDGPVSIGPYVPRVQRTLELKNGAMTPVPAGHTTCLRAPLQDVFGAGFASKVRPDFGDVRVFASGVEVKRTIDALRTGVLVACFRLTKPIAPGAVDTTYVVRYGDPNALVPPPADGDVFDFFDGFDGSSLGQGWRKLGNPIVAGGTVTFPKNVQSGITSVADTDGIGLEASLEIKARVTNPSSAGELLDGGESRWYWFGFQHLGDFDAFEPWSVFIARSKSEIHAEHKSSGTTTCAPGCAQPPRTQTTDFRVYTVARTGADVLFTLDDATVFAANSAVGDLSILIRSYALDSELVVDWVRARPLVVPEPALAIGIEETVP